MLDKLISLVGSVAPILGTVLGSPLAGTAIALISQKLFGTSSSTVSEILNSLKTNPENIIRLKEIEADLIKHQSDNDLASEKLGADNALAQIEINKISADKGFFYSAPRSLLLWLGVVALTSNMIVIPYLAAFGVLVPVVDLSLLYGLLMILIGARSVDLIKGVK